MRLNLPDYDKRSIHYGMQLGLFYGVSRLQHTAFFADSAANLLSVRGANKPGFTIGIIVNISLDDPAWDFRINPSVSLFERTVDFNYTDGTTESKVSEATLIELPLMLKYQSLRRKNSRVFITGGIIPSVQVGNIEEGNRNTLNFSRGNLEVGYSLGMHLYMKYFNLTPEIRFSHGVSSILNPVNNEYDRQISSLLTHRVSFFLNFEG